MKSTPLIYRRCKRKVAHKSKGAALAHLRGLEKVGRMDERTRAYVCSYCRQWHVGHSKQTARVTAE